MESDSSMRAHQAASTSPRATHRSSARSADRPPLQPSARYAQTVGILGTLVVACTLSFLAGYGSRVHEPGFPWAAIDYPISQAEALAAALVGLKQAEIDISTHYVFDMEFDAQSRAWVFWLHSTEPITCQSFHVNVDAQTRRAVYHGHFFDTVELHPGNRPKPAGPSLPFNVFPPEPSYDDPPPPSAPEAQGK